MKALSLWQPWASLWLTPRKTHETRAWPTRHRGPLAVHAAKRIETDVSFALERICRAEFGAAWRDTLPRGALLGYVLITACTPTCSVDGTPAYAEDGDDLDCGNWTPGRYAWRRGAIVAMPPVPWRGWQGLFDVPDELVRVPSLEHFS